MAREKTPPPDTTGDVPSWFMTYSDVITLLMTFFILLLTFATNEPEKFEQMQVSMFGGGGAVGIVTDPDGPLEKDSMLARVRPKASRLTRRGSESPPIHDDLATASLQKGLKALEGPLEHDLSTTRSIKLALSALVDANGNMTTLGGLLSKRMAQRIVSRPYLVNLEVVRPDQLASAIALSQTIAKEANMPTGSVGVGMRMDSLQDPGEVRITITREWNEPP